MKTNSKTLKLVRLSLFLALGIVFNILESLVPLPIPIPGVRLGLANLMTLVVLYYYGPKEYISIGFLRVLIVALLRTGIGSVASILSFSGWLLSTLFVLLFYSLKKPSIFGLSIGSAVFHALGQNIAIIFIYSLPEMINYLPVLLISSTISGFIVAYLSTLVLKLLNKSFGLK